jgi:hypothetical protein
MTICLRRVWAAGLIAGVLAMSALAAPPEVNYQGRMYGNWLGGSLCSEIVNGTFCRDLFAVENYDVKGTYEYTEASLTHTRNQYDPSDGSWTNGWRYLSCPVDKKAISAHGNSATFEATLDPDAPGCYSYGSMESWDPINGYQYEPWVFPVPMNVVGKWIDPFNHGRETMKIKETSYDGWTDTSGKFDRYCTRNWGELMRDGGFSVNDRVYPFEGPEGPAMSYFSLNSCNTHSVQR